MSVPLASGIRETTHRGQDDLLSAGIGLAGLRATPPVFANPAAPTPLELRRRAIHASWRGIADLGPLGGYGDVYGAVPGVPGREYGAFALIPGARTPHRVLAQIPDAFAAKSRCLLVAPSSGSRGVYGAIALAAAWGLPRGCAIAYTDKGTGPGYFDLATQTGVSLDGTRARRGDALLDFEPQTDAGTRGVAVKHAHSTDNPEADWGRHVRQAALFGMAMLDRAWPEQAPFTPANTRVIAVGLSNGGGAVLQAAGLDDDHLLAGVVALAPNVQVAPHGRALYDYATEAALLLPCALLDTRFDANPFAGGPNANPQAGAARCQHLRDAGMITGANTATQARSALDQLRSTGWSDRALDAAASSTALDLWRAIAVTYASAYLRRKPDSMPCGYSFGALDPNDAATRAAWWSDESGIPPGAGVELLAGEDSSADSDVQALECLRGLWTGDGIDARQLQASVAATAAKVPRADLPIIIAHGESDGLLPIAFASSPYVSALETVGRAPIFWRVPHAQHFDAFLAIPDFGDRYVPLLPYGYAALDALWAHLAGHVALPVSRRCDTSARGNTALRAGMLDLDLQRRWSR